MKKEEKKDIHKPIHDIFFRDIYSHKKFCPDILRLVLTERELQLLDLNTLNLEVNTIVNEGKEKRMDITLSVNLKGSEKKARILFLIEHKSYRDSDLLKQVLQYQAAIYNQTRDPVIPIVVYHGKERKYRGALTFHDYLNNFSAPMRQQFGENVLNFTCRFLNIQELDIEKEVNDLTSAPVLFILKNIWSIDEQSLGQFFSLLQGCDRETREELMKMAVSYITQYNPSFTKNRLQEIEEKHIENEEERSMKAVKSLLDLEAEQNRQEGIQEGIQKGRQEGIQEGIQKGRQEGIQEGQREIVLRMIQDGADVKMICRYTKLSPEEVEKLR